MALSSGKAAWREGGGRPPNAAQRCIHASARGYISHPVLDKATVNRGRCSGRCSGRCHRRCSEFSVNQSKATLSATRTTSRALGAFSRGKAKGLRKMPCPNARPDSVFLGGRGRMSDLTPSPGRCRNNGAPCLYTVVAYSRVRAVSRKPAFATISVAISIKLRPSGSTSCWNTISITTDLPLAFG